MNNLHFRAWHKEFKKFVKIDGIEFPDIVYEIIPYGGGERIEYVINKDVILMQGIEIGDQIVYVGDIIEKESSFINGDNYKVEIKNLYHLFQIKRDIVEDGLFYKFVGNIYEWPRQKALAGSDYIID